jgi:hypothetical protein
VPLQRSFYRPGYPVPTDVEHSIIWSRIPIIHPALVPDPVWGRVQHDGLKGFTGDTSPPPSPSGLPDCLSALSEWGVTMDDLVRSQRGTEDEEQMVRRAGEEVDRFVRRRWIESEWETAWFVNPRVGVLLHDVGFAILTLHTRAVSDVPTPEASKCPGTGTYSRICQTQGDLRNLRKFSGELSISIVALNRTRRTPDSVLPE